MQIPQIRLESTRAQIGIQTNPAVQEISQPKADLSIQQPKAEVSIETTPSKLTVDQTKAWEDMDLKHISRRIKEAAQQGYEDWLSGLARVAQQGDQLMMIENGGNPIAEQAKVNSEDPIYDFNIGYIPSPNSVKLDYQPSRVNIDIRPQKPIIESRMNKPEHNYTPANVEIYLDQRNSLKIDFVNIEV